MLKLKKREYVLLAVVLALLVAGLFGPFVAQPAHQHGFADQRVWGSVPFAMDVLSNLPFALWGALGLGSVALLILQKRLPEPQAGQAHIQTRIHTLIEPSLAALFFVGLLATAAGSSFYHWRPDNSGLAIDRLGMAVAFAGLLGLAAAGRVSVRAGLALAGAVLVFGALSVRVWVVHGNALPWVLVQFGGMAMVVWFACLGALPGSLPVRWGIVIMIYALAKLLELGDHQIYDVTSQLVSGHSLKHGVASLAAWPVLAAVGSWLKTSPGTTGQKPKSCKISAESLLLVQRVSSTPLSGQLHIPQTLSVYKTDKHRS